MRNKTGMFLIALLILAMSKPVPSYASGQTSDTSATLATATVSAKPVVDIRGKILQSFLADKHSPLQDDADVLIGQADANNLDWKLLPSIAGVESGYCIQIPVASYNCWGFGIYGDHVKRFDSWSEAVSTISASLHNDYILKWHATTVNQIGQIYAADPYWAYKVENNMNELNTYYAKFADHTLSISL